MSSEHIKPHTEALPDVKIIRFRSFDDYFTKLCFNSSVTVQNHPAIVERKGTIIKRESERWLRVERCFYGNKSVLFEVLFGGG